MDKPEALGAIWPKGEEKVADRERDAVTKGNCLLIENPAPFSHNLSHNRAADARFCSASSSLLRSHGGERMLCWKGLHIAALFITERVLCRGAVISVCDRLDSGMLADSRNLAHHISLPSSCQTGARHTFT